MVIPLIETDLGTLQGVFEENINGGTYVAFKGIPYALPPVGDLRFRDPVPNVPWTGIRDATEFGEVCCQYDSGTGRCIGSEDCLYLNVYMPNLDLSNLKAVMIWIHGGAFKNGSGNDDVYGVDYLIKSDVVIVTLNYRLGCLGFLHLGDKAASGNQGLKDQVIALKWVKRNISRFGGDPNNITMFGQSAGSVCIHYLALSPMARGLFQKAILQSGLISTIARATSLVQVGNRLASILGVSIANPKALVEYLRTVKVDKLIEAQEELVTPEEHAALVLSFIPGPDGVSDNPFFPETESDAMKLKISIPCILGYVNEEFSAKQDLCTAASGISKSLFPVIIQDYYNDRNLPIHKIVKHYMGEDVDDERIIPKFVHLATDAVFLSSMHAMFETQRKISDAQMFYYKFSFESRKTLMKMKFTFPGTGHGDDLSFLFYHKLMGKLGRKPLCLDAIHNRIIQRFVDMWTNFAKTGNPTPKITKLIPVIWEPIDKTKFHEYKYLKITDALTMESEENHFQSLIQNIEKSK
ncbi:uncharacterized protein LOC107042478 isoform X1 [Diachasma alloeum]|uniref:uncharacterized protein LOC107042478 isoform X1 n=1 Tax=Diachasma alloeum TaxID=454923 RepID=UPI0007381F3A|nr:uncharacterized protein LOC107042478 isoform X1 [Diachasma alloeum]